MLAKMIRWTEYRENNKGIKNVAIFVASEYCKQTADEYIQCSIIPKYGNQNYVVESINYHTCLEVEA